MTYTESAALMMDTAFRGRVKVAGLKYANYILIEPDDTVAHSARLRWANNFILNPDIGAGQIQPMTVMDAKVQQDGPAITDANLQIAVEAVVNKIV